MNGKYYSYIFLRKDLIPEQVAIQAAHVSMLVAQAMGEERPWVDFNQLNFVMVPMSMDAEALCRALEEELEHTVERFYDKLYYFNEDGDLTYEPGDVITAIMTHPMLEEERGILQMLPLYRIRK